MWPFKKQPEWPKRFVVSANDPYLAIDLGHAQMKAWGYVWERDYDSISVTPCGQLFEVSAYQDTDGKGNGCT